MSDVPSPDSIRNVAIIAHVDHGKTTLVDRMLSATGTFRAGQDVPDRVMDSNPLEREKGITIFSKHASIRWQGPDGEAHKINLVDTPGHADFGGEVERILRMVDGVLLLVDAFEGPMPQTRFVTRKALALGLQPVVVVNKVDREDSGPERVHDEVLELFMELGASDAQLDAPFLYASAKEGWVSAEAVPAGGRPAGSESLRPLFRSVVDRVPAPAVSEGPFRMLVSTLDYSPYLGRLAIGRVEQGRVRPGDPVAVWSLGEEEPGETARVPKLYTYRGLEREEVEEAGAGDIVALAGLEEATIGATLCDPDRPERLEGIAVEPPTIAVQVLPNDSPFSGSGQYVTARQIKERLDRETLDNVALRVEETDRPDRFRVSGRGELHLAVVMEQMRREGYEFCVSRPEVITREGPDGEVQEPYETVVVDVPDGLMGAVIQGLGERRGEMVSMEQGEGKLVRLRFSVPTRGLAGYRSEFLRETRGEGTLHRQFEEYGPWAGPIERRRTGALVSMTRGTATAYAIYNLQDRGTMFVEPGDEVYDGMIVGENAREPDLEVNVTKGKKLTNVRAAGADEKIELEPAQEVDIEFGMEFIQDDELIEIAPEEVRLRKRALTSHERKKQRKKAGWASPGSGE